jgi:HEPN domain-containing protein
VNRGVASLLILAGRDLQAARILFESDPGNAAFHAQQAAEKLTKAVLGAEGIREGTRHHQIGQLARLLSPEHPWRNELESLDRLSAAATWMRYPGPDGTLPEILDTAALAGDIAEVEALLSRIQAWLEAHP